MKILKEFQEFAIKGNVLDMAVGIIIGAAFSTIVNSLVNDILMPPIGLALGKVDFSNLFFTIYSPGEGTFSTPQAAEKAGAVTINYGLFLNNVISFLIVSFSVFLVVKNFNHLRKKIEKEPALDKKKCTECCSEIPIEANRCRFCTQIFKS